MLHWNIIYHSWQRILGDQLFSLRILKEFPYITFQLPGLLLGNLKTFQFLICCNLFFFSGNFQNLYPKYFNMSEVPCYFYNKKLWVLSRPFLFKKNFFKFIFREAGREGERQRENRQCVRDVSISCLSHVLTWGPGLHWESKQRPFSLQASTESTEPYQVGHEQALFNWKAHVLQFWDMQMKRGFL